MIYMKTILDVADNSGARKASFIGVLNARGRRSAQVGELVRVNIKESAPRAGVKKAKLSRQLLFGKSFLYADLTEHMLNLIAMPLSLLMIMAIQEEHVFLAQLLEN